jgi:tRNA (adenine22-N1)-methyltransferase
MRQITLTPRLRLIADLIESTPSQESPKLNANETFADIGTDHGYLPYVLMQEGKIDRAFLCDVNQGPLDNAASTFAGSPFTQNILYRLGSGLSVLKPGEASRIAIAGMGGNLIQTLLEEAPEPFENAVQVILQPMTEQAALRAWLIKKGVSFIDYFVAEGHKLYEVIAVYTKLPGIVRQPERTLDIPSIAANDTLEFGYRVALRTLSDYQRFLLKKEQKYQKILTGLQRSNRDSDEAIQTCQHTLEAIRRIRAHLDGMI